MYLEVTKNETVLNEITNNTYVRTTFRPVKDFLANGKSIFAGDLSGTKLYNEGKEPQEGDVFEGNITQVGTTPYVIGDKTVNKITVVHFSGESAYDVANKMLNRGGVQTAVALDANGKPTAAVTPKPEAEVKDTATA